MAPDFRTAAKFHSNTY